MILLELPWLELALTLCVVGALFVSQLRDPMLAARGGLILMGLVFSCTFLAWLGFYLGAPAADLDGWSFQPRLVGRRIFRLDELNAPLVPAVSLLHFLMAVATARTKMRRFSFAWSLASESLRVGTFACTEPWVLIGLLCASTVPAYLELANRRKPTRVYVLHMACFVGLLILGWAGVEAAAGHGDPPVWASVALLVAILIRCGTVPVHCWLTDWFEHASFGIAILFVAPLVGVYAAVRLVLPIAPNGVLQSLAFISLVTAVYAAAMATVQRDARRFFAYLFLSHSSLVLVGLELIGSRQFEVLSLTGALCLWFSVILSLGGFGLTLRALEARFGRLSLTDYYGLYDHSPTLAVCFLITGLASVGFPGTIGFISAELLVDGAVEVNSYAGLAVVVAAALNGIAVIRAYFLLFTGTRHASTVSLRIGTRERFAVLTLAALILGGGLCPQPGVFSRFQAAEEILKHRPRPAGISPPRVSAQRN